jgi:hypothetical protein
MPQIVNDSDAAQLAMSAITMAIGVLRASGLRTVTWEEWSVTCDM